ncbi:MAG: acetyl-CoA carboxylase biotin carboxylase subunit [Candidatus Kapabacteria bacterium]|nr:acetyl-CoA carboxylase biotin carboxylase subunit [Candidatus Kapabacteria bacterium]
MFKRVLIANRGEIALRVMRTCRRLGIETVAIYSDADVSSPHVSEADHAIGIGGFTPRESYLVVDKVLDAARRSGADAIHPGYGFLSENADFAHAVAEMGLTFIGPSPEAIAMLGDKTAARDLAIRSDVPISPGSDGAVATFDEARAVVERIGFPVIIKAAAGGGGKGMRIVEEQKDIETAFRAAQNEALASFNDERVFIERYIVQPRHIEIQILADHHGTVLYFPERECSVQRRHQKVIEESPSTAVTPAIRRAMGEAAARLVTASNYTNAGTLEFLLDASGEFYFMEVNTRLQVEHPVTEMISGVDFVEQQLLIAFGQPLAMSQQDIAEPKGAAIECRVCAEDVFNEFLPDTGVVSFMQLPSGDGIRNDTALYEGYEVSVHYDPMVAKLIVHAPTRQECIERTIAALDDYHIVGFKTTIPFCRLVLDSEPFRTGAYSTFYVKEHWPIDHGDEFLSMLSLVSAAGFSAEDDRRSPMNHND